MPNNAADVLYQDGFWETAFEHDVPFLEEYRTSFRRGLIDCNVRLIDLHREAIYYLSDGALWPVISRLIELAPQYADGSFIESLSHFLETPMQRSRIANAVAAATEMERLKLGECLMQLMRKLHATRDDQLLPGFERLCSALRAPD